MTGLFYFVFGLFSGIGALVFYRIPKEGDVRGIDCILLYYIIFTIIAGLGFVAYSIVAFLYKNRERPFSLEEENVSRRRLYTGEVPVS